MNIDRFSRMLTTATDPVKRAMETKLLADGNEKLRNVSPNAKPAF
jgi:hypothetical protein